MAVVQSFMGFLALAGLAWLFSEHRRSLNWKTIGVGMVIQLLLGALLIKMPAVQNLFTALNHIVQALDAATRSGTAFVFGYLGGGELPFAETRPTATYILAFRGLPLVLVMSALSALLFYWRIIPAVVKGFAKFLQWAMDIGGVEGLGATANIFVGMVESPLLIRPYLATISRSELFAIMVCGMATVAGTVMVLYATILGGVVPGILGHLLAASVISAPAALVVAKLMIPETKEPSSGKIHLPQEAKSAMDAITRGAGEGVHLLIHIIAMLIVLVALVYLINLGFGLLPAVGHAPLTFQRVMGWIFAPITWLMGVPGQETVLAGSLMGTKTVLNEFLAYLHLAQVSPEAMGGRTRLIMTYAMCGFANFGSLGIMIGGMGAMVSERREEIAALGLKSIVGGTIATCMTGAVAGIFY
ncbi:nucleoside:proton symporter [candidate division FCPU426 bacterium]|nr:nucleoside:proton symporter [candidate division FCPU426 bacterium]